MIVCITKRYINNEAMKERRERGSNCELTSDQIMDLSIRDRERGRISHPSSALVSSFELRLGRMLKGIWSSRNRTNVCIRLKSFICLLPTLLVIY